jgi:hypothetical protein
VEIIVTSGAVDVVKDDLPQRGYFSQSRTTSARLLPRCSA